MQQIDFIYHFMGTDFEVIATFNSGCPRPVGGYPNNDPYGHEPTLDDIEVIPLDGGDQFGEMQNVFVKRAAGFSLEKSEMISIATLIEEEAFDRYSNEMEAA